MEATQQKEGRSGLHEAFSCDIQQGKAEKSLTNLVPDLEGRIKEGRSP